MPNFDIPLIKAAFGYLRDNSGRLLMVANDYGDKGIMWGVPGGTREDGEPPESTVVREFAEEVGLKVRVTRRVGLIKRVKREWNLNLEAEFFEVEHTGGTVRIDPDEEHVVDAQFMSPAEIADWPQPVLGRGRLLQYLNDPMGCPSLIIMSEDEE